MRAAVFPEFGHPVSVINLPIPQPGPGEMRVHVRASSVNGFDLAVAGGYARDWFEHRFPVVLGRDFAGTIDAVGTGVTRFAVGESVFGVIVKQVLGDGGFGEYVIVADGPGIVPLSENLELATAGALGLAGTSAVLAVEAVAPKAGESVLICGAPGGVGSFAVQLAAQRGAEVVATAHRGDQEDYVRRLGATYVVDRDGDLAAQVRAIRPEGMHAVIHLGGDGPSLARLLAPGGRFASLLGVGPEQLDGAAAQATSVVAWPDSAILKRLGSDVAAGRLRVPIHATYGLENITEALADFADGKSGKIAIAID
ncbi:MAG TPA: NADP-dependent oxidoreductase [Chloroflexota bacterium]